MSNNTPDGRMTSSLDDPIVTEIIRHSLDSAANEMKRTLIRTAFSPIIYEVLDFAVAIYDPQYRLLSQAPSLPIFMGTMDFCVKSAIEAIGGQSALRPGDVILYNIPYGTGSHQPDSAVVVPVFYDDRLMAVTTIKGHWLDIGAKDPYCTDTVDVYQEGTIYPGVKLYDAGILNRDLYRMVIANSRLPETLAGDMNAEIAGCRAGEAALQRIFDRYGREVFERCVEQIFDHSEAVIHEYFEKLPDGYYIAHGKLDSNGVSDDEVPFDVTVVIDGDKVRLDFTDAPDQQPGPINCPRPSTVSASRVAISMLAGHGESPNEGQFRAVDVVTRRGSLFEPESPAPTFLYGWPAIQAMDVIYRAISDALPESVPAGSGGCICSLVWWGRRQETGAQWIDGEPHPVGQGGSVLADGGTSMHFAEAATRLTPTEIWEARNPWVVERIELARDSAGAGAFQGGQGVDFEFKMLEETFVTCVAERTKTAPWGINGGLPGRPNRVAIRRAGGTSKEMPGKFTAMRLGAGDVLELHTGGGGGYGDPSDRDAAKVRADILDGYISHDFATQFYPAQLGS